MYTVCVCVCAAYTYAEDIGQCHCVAKYHEKVVTEDRLEFLQHRRVVLGQGRVLEKHSHMSIRSQRHDTDVEVRGNVEGIFKAAMPLGHFSTSLMQSLSSSSNIFLNSPRSM